MFLPAERRPTIAESEIEHWKTGMTSSNSPSNTLKKKKYHSYYCYIVLFVSQPMEIHMLEKWIRKKMFCNIYFGLGTVIEKLKNLEAL